MGFHECFLDGQEVRDKARTAESAQCGGCHEIPVSVALGETLAFEMGSRVASNEHLNTFGRTDGRVFHAMVPLANDEVGTLQLGVWDRTVNREIAAVTEGLLKSLVICVLIGLGLAFGLTYLLAHPIHSLVHATERLRDGDFSSRARVHSDDEIGRLARIFNTMAETLQGYERAVIEKDKSRLSLIKKIVRAQDEERKSVARELHDQLGQSLSKTLLTFQGMQSRCDIEDPLCDEIEKDIRSLIDDVRHLASDIRPSVLDDFGLDSALQRYSREITERTGLTVDYQLMATPDVERLHGVVEVTLYRITQEAVTNVLRHADANNASVILIHNEDEATLIVEDDGCGFAMPEDTGGNGHYLGLLGMKERVGLIGGEFKIESQSGQGTVVRVTVSLKGEL